METEHVIVVPYDPQWPAALYPEDIERYLAHKAPFIKAVYADAMKSQVLTIPKER